MTDFLSIQKINCFHRSLTLLLPACTIESSSATAKWPIPAYTVKEEKDGKPEKGRDFE